MQAVSIDWFKNIGYSKTEFLEIYSKWQIFRKILEKQYCILFLQRKKVLPHFSSCPRSYDVSEAGLRVGCFKDSSGDRLLKGALVKDKLNEPDFCVK